MVRIIFNGFAKLVAFFGTILSHYSGEVGHKSTEAAIMATGGFGTILTVRVEWYPLTQRTLPYQKHYDETQGIVNYYAVVSLLHSPYLLCCGPFFERKNVCSSQENGVRTRCAAIANHSAIVNSLRVVNLLRVVFLVRRGPLGNGTRRKVRTVFPVEPESPNGKNIQLHKKWGFPPIPERVPKSALFAGKKARKKCGFPHFLALFLESAETPLFVQINVFAVWALRLDRKIHNNICIVFPALWLVLEKFQSLGGAVSHWFLQLFVLFLNAHSSTPTPVFLPSHEETQTMVREKHGPKLRPPQTLYLLGKGETQTMV